MARKLKTEDYTLTYGVPEYREMVELYDFAEAVHAWVFGIASTDEQDLLSKRRAMYEEINQLYSISNSEEAMKVATLKQPRPESESGGGAARGRPTKMPKRAAQTRQQIIHPSDAAMP